MSNKFQVGDRVEFTVPEYVAKVGEKGTIRVIDPDFKNLLGVELDKNLGGHSLDGKCESGHGCWANSRQLRLIGRKFLSGQVYLVGNGMKASGNIIRVLDVYTNELGYEHCRYQTIRGNTPSSGHLDFGVDSPFSNALTLLTGKEIGEAIKKWDTDHAPKSEREYTEVKRPAKPGEYIKALRVDCADEGRFRVGAILKVTSVPDEGFWKGKAVCYNNTYCVIKHDQYIVLEGYSPDKAESPAEPKEENQKAKVGDTIKVLKDNGGPVTKGTVWEVTRIDSCRLTVKNEKYSGNYAVNLDNYVVLSPGKHRYTDSQIAEAKRIVLDIIREYAEKSEYVLFDSIGETADNYRGYWVPKGSETDFDYGELTISEVKAGESKCGPNDEPNEWIGKCVAVCKLLGKSIPRFIMENGAEKRFDYEKAKRKGTSKDAKMVVIHFNDDSERDEALKAIEEMGIKWNTGKKPTEWKIFHDNFLVIKEGSLYYGKPSWESNYVEFSDCFTEI